ncbi:transporter substrate-binding domain-containing protein [Azospirillum formosense]|uniref:Transporter substrate-binding domain-containing protein n=2 Tax=Azospirillum formosense TaxID=861533 RepID=A0ABX2KX81_9PROT|nr:amino acid ABC transporter substrate-binding protein [Azospirillum formosense]NUB18436.1 transporter substrate-binding domain-containing protein [Azospirillum formosense]
MRFPTANAVLTLAVLLAGLALTQPVQADAPPPAGRPLLRVVVIDHSPPFSDHDAGGDLVGFNVDFGRELCRSLGAVCSFDAAPFKQIIDDVATGRFDIGFGNVLRTPEREQRLLFSIPYWRSSTSLVGHRGTPELSLEEAIRSRRIAAIRGSRQHAALVRLADSDPTLQSNLVPVSTLDDLWEAMRSGQSDMAIGPTLNVVHFLLSDSGDGFETIGTPMSENGLGGTVHIVFPPGQHELKASVDRALTALRNDGTYQRINRKYFPFDIY